MRRKALSARASRKSFKRGRKSDRKNVRLAPERGGFRL